MTQAESVMPERRAAARNSAMWAFETLTRRWSSLRTRAAFRLLMVGTLTSVSHLWGAKHTLGQGSNVVEM